MKIILATPLFPPEIEALSTYSKDLAEHLKANHELLVVAFVSQVEKVEGVKIVKVNKQRPLLVRLFDFFNNLMKLSKGADIIYAQNAVACGLPAIIAGRFKNIPVVINFAEDEAWKRAMSLGMTDKSLDDYLTVGCSNRKNHWIMNLQSWVLRRADKVVVSSQALGDIICKHYHLDKNKVVVNYRPEDQIQKLSFPIEIKKGQIFTSGRLVDWVGYEKLIMAVSKIEDVELLIAGDGPIRKNLENLSKELKVEDRVKFLGQISKAENWYLRQTSQIYFANFSGNNFLRETTLSLLAGSQIMAFDTPLAREILSENLVKENELVDRLKELLSAEIKIQKLADKFSWASHVSILEDLFQSLAKK